MLAPSHAAHAHRAVRVPRESMTGRVMAHVAVARVAVAQTQSAAVAPTQNKEKEQLVGVILEDMQSMPGAPSGQVRLSLRWPAGISAVPQPIAAPMPSTSPAAPGGASASVAPSPDGAPPPEGAAGAAPGDAAAGAAAPEDAATSAPEDAAAAAAAAAPGGLAVPDITAAADSASAPAAASAPAPPSPKGAAAPAGTATPPADPVAVPSGRQAPAEPSEGSSKGRPSGGPPKAKSSKDASGGQLPREVIADSREEAHIKAALAKLGLELVESPNNQQLEAVAAGVLWEGEEVRHAVLLLRWGPAACTVCSLRCPAWHCAALHAVPAICTPQGRHPWLTNRARRPHL